MQSSLLSGIRLSPSSGPTANEFREATEPYHFLKIAYPKAKKPRTAPLVMRVRAGLGMPPVDEDDTDLEERIKRILRKMLQEEPTFGS